MTVLKLTTVGNSVGVIFPREVLAKLRATKGDYVFLVERPDGYTLTPYDPEFARQMEVAEAVMRENRDALRALAKE